MPERKEGVIFDLDGVLCSTDEYHYRAWKSLADSLGISFDRTVNCRLRGVSREDSLEIILENAQKRYSEEEKRQMCEKKNILYRSFLAELSEEDLAPDARETLNELRRIGVKIAIGSSSKNATFILQRLGIYDLFDAVVDGNCISRSKPDPEVFLRAAQFLGLPSERCAVVEDSHAGIDAAKAGGFFAVAIGDACSHPFSDCRLNRLSDILQLYYNNV